MARATLRADQQQIEGEFLEVEIPQFDFFKINLVHKKTNWVNVKTNELDRVEHNFNITIGVGDFMNGEDKELSKSIKEICKLPFVPYYWQEKHYRFYTMERTGTVEEKKEILKKLFSYLKQYEIDKNDLFKESTKTFEKDAAEKIQLETIDLLLKYHEGIDKFVVLAKDFLGNEKYSLLRRSSEYSGKLVSKENIHAENQNKYIISSDFFSDNPKKFLDKTYFVVNPSYYDDIKNHFIKEANDYNKFLEEQKKISSTHDLSQYNIEEENIFDIRIKFNEKEQCFEFYGKGYFDSEVYNGYKTPRSLLAMWANNFIYTQDKVEGNVCYADDLYVDKHKIDFTFVKGGSKKERNLKIPASEWEKVKILKENFLREQQFWTRPEKIIKISHCDFSGLDILKNFPLIYFDNHGSPFLIYSSRRTGVFKSLWAAASKDPDLPDMIKIEFDENGNVIEKKKRNTKFSQTFKSIPISYEEAKYFMEQHPFSDHILRATKVFNIKAWSDPSINYFAMTQEEKDNIFDTVLLHAQLQSQSAKVPLDNKKSKKIKI